MKKMLLLLLQAMQSEECLNAIDALYRSYLSGESSQVKKCGRMKVFNSPNFQEFYTEVKFCSRKAPKADIENKKKFFVDAFYEIKKKKGGRLFDENYFHFINAHKMELRGIDLKGYYYDVLYNDFLRIVSTEESNNPHTDFLANKINEDIQYFCVQKNSDLFNGLVAYYARENNYQKMNECLDFLINIDSDNKLNLGKHFSNKVSVLSKLGKDFSEIESCMFNALTFNNICSVLALSLCCRIRHMTKEAEYYLQCYEELKEDAEEPQDDGSKKRIWSLLGRDGYAGTTDESGIGLLENINQALYEGNWRKLIDLLDGVEEKMSFFEYLHLRAFYNVGDYQAVIALAKKYKKYGKYPRALYCIGVSYFMVRDRDNVGKALDLLNRASWNGDEEAQQLFGNLLSKFNDMGQSLESSITEPDTAPQIEVPTVALSAVESEVNFELPAFNREDLGINWRRYFAQKIEKISLEHSFVLPKHEERAERKFRKLDQATVEDKKLNVPRSNYEILKNIYTAGETHVTWDDFKRLLSKLGGGFEQLHNGKWMFRLPSLVSSEHVLVRKFDNPTHTPGERFIVKKNPTHMWAVKDLLESAGYTLETVFPN